MFTLAAVWLAGLSFLPPHPVRMTSAQTPAIHAIRDTFPVVRTARVFVVIWPLSSLVGRRRHIVAEVHDAPLKRRRHELLRVLLRCKVSGLPSSEGGTKTPMGVQGKQLPWQPVCPVERERYQVST
ncbi:MAG: hypothetical protein ACOZJZ_17175 [Pseudomonadota bacterium]